MVPRGFHFNRRKATRRGGRYGALSVAVGWVVLAIVFVGMEWGLSGCQYDRMEGWEPTGKQPTVRVRVAKSVEAVELTSSGPLRVSAWVGAGGTTQAGQTVAGPVKILRGRGEYLIRPGRGQPFRWAVVALHIEAPDRGPIGLDGVRYPRVLIVRAVSDAAGPGGAGGPGGKGTMDVINQLPMDLYLPGVLDRELPSDWHESAYEAQAIAARSYALDLCGKRRGDSFDLEATQASQVYGGVTRNARAVRAVQRTQGMALTYQGRVLPAYFSSTCGGTGQDAAAVFPHGLDVPPLRGRAHGAWCSGSKYYRWGPIARDRGELARRIAAWGHQQGHPIARLTGISQVVVSGVNGVQRPTRFRVVDVNGAGYELNAEAFRTACNADAPGLAKVSADEQIRSSFVAVTSEGGRLVFRGRGFGHGVGLCQWGAQGLARGGYKPAAILAFYYPEARIEKVY